MNSRTESRMRVSERLRIVTARRNATIVLSVIAVAVVVSLLHQIGIAITADKTPLSCTYSATDAHTHDESCYRDGNLVCPVPEREEHTHTDECYKEAQVLMCGQEEGDGHTHDESCYETQRVLACGMEETTGVHIHDASCFYASKATMTEIEKEFEKSILDADDNPVLTVRASVPAGAIPQDADMLVTPIPAEAVSDAVQDEVSKDERETIVTEINAVDISFVMPTGEKVEPLAPVTVTMTSPTIAEGTGEALVVHIDDDNNTETMEILDGEELEQRAIRPEDDQLSFESESFSKYVLATVSRSQHLVASDGNSYEVTLECPAVASIPNDTELSVTEIGADTAEYEAYKGASEEALGASVSFARFFDISLRSPDGQEIQPAEGTTVSVQVLVDGLPRDAGEEQGSEPQVIHFGQEPEILASSTDGDLVSFDASGFSVYAIVDVPPAKEFVPEITNVVSLEELFPNADAGFFLSVANGTSYFQNTLNKNSCFVETTSLGAASVWFFEPVADGVSQYRIYTMANGVQKYVTTPGGNLVGLGDIGSAATFELEETSGFFYIKVVGQSKWLQHSGSGGGIRLWTDHNNATNSRVTLTYATALTPDDPHSLDGQTYSFAYNAGDKIIGMMAEPTVVSGTTEERLLANSMHTQPDIEAREGVLYVAQGADLAEWTFHSLGGELYNVTTTLGDGTTAYLCLDNGGVYLSDSPAPESATLTVTTGTGANATRLRLAANGRVLCLVGGDANKGFGTSASDTGTMWISLVEKSSVQDEDFTSYRARKVSVANTEEIKNGDYVVMYTRIWNESALRYEDYVIDYDGKLIRAYSSGDVIQWVGNSEPTSLWELIEYSYDDGTPTYYYDMQNAYSGKYIAPQIGNGQILSDDTLGLNLNGRRYGDDYTTIVAWDDPYYEYAGLKVSDGHLVSCPIAQAEDIYFAVITPVPEPGSDEELTTVKTVDNDDYGITMRMVNFNHPNSANTRDTVQNPFFGVDSNSNGILSSNFGEDGYPVTSMAVTGHEDSIAEMFAPSQMIDVNHLFTKSTYEESGYFEYDSTKNFASLQADGNFKVYDQLAGIGTTNKASLKHGQFMPFNDITPGKYSIWTNQTDVLGQTLSDLDPRKGETLFLIESSEADYFFGMEMEATFTQTASGLDSWGHDIIFEFAGDDDFWLYVDEELVLDIGGIHSASTGSINFRTGEISMVLRDSNGKVLSQAQRPTVASLYEAFHNNYIARGMTEEQTQAKLDELFTLNANGQHVFKDYTRHTMKVFYMERGGSASNLKMRFNLTATKPGTVSLTKKISGTEQSDYSLAEFPYQIFYRLEEEGGYQLLSDTNAASSPTVTYANTRIPAKFKATYTPSGGTNQYHNVFFLQPDQSIDIALPEGTIDYYIQECGINSAIYESVVANGTELEGTATSDEGRYDYAVPPASIEERQKVEYTNHVKDSALRTLSITKRLFDADGTTPINYPQDRTLFDYRLSLSGETSDTLTPAYMHNYHVKDPNGNYCRWDVAGQTFVSLGKTSYGDLTDDEKAQATFVTSPNGAISKIPADHTVEVRELIVDSKFKVIERSDEIPAGYKLLRYQRVNGSYIEDNDGTGSGGVPNEGTIRANDDPAIEVHNQRGWGITAEKEWSDASFTSSHEAIYMAIYLDDGNGNLTMLPGSVHQIPKKAESTYWFFESLVPGKSFDDYVLREVHISEESPNVQSDGTVTNPGTVTPVEPGGTLHAEATLKSATEPEEYVYKAAYAPGEATGAATDINNVRTDKVTNSRPGIRIVKTNWSGNALAGATFTLTDDDGNPVGSQRYTSGNDGLVTIAYLPDGHYLLTETKAPSGYQGLADSISITISNETDDVRVTAIDRESDGDAYTFITTGDMPILAVRNHTSYFEFIKADENGDPLAGAKFQIYRQMLAPNGKLRPEDNPVEGYDNLVSNADGLISADLQLLPKGTYYLIETEAPDGYRLPSEDMIFSIGANGAITISETGPWEIDTTVTSGHVTCAITVTNNRQSSISIKKVDISDPAHSCLEGAKFDLYEVIDGVRADTPLRQGMTSNAQGLLVHEGLTVFEVLPGIYDLVETEAPDGYSLLTAAVRIRVSNDSVTYDDGTSLSRSGEGLSHDATNDIYTLKVANSTGYALPNSGDFGYALQYAVGLVMIGGAVLYYWKKGDIMRRIMPGR